jgi:hypothetical protein
MPDSSGIPVESVPVPAGPARVKGLGVRGRRPAGRYGWDRCAGACARLFDVAAAR